MSSTVVILLAVAAIVIVAMLFSRRGEKKLPEDIKAARPPSEEPGPRASLPPAAGVDSAQAQEGDDSSAEASKVESTRPPKASEEEAGVAAREEAAPASARPPPRQSTAPPPRRVSGEPSAEDVEALKKGLASTRGGFIARLAKLFSGNKEIDPALLDEIEEVLITADIGVPTSNKILDQLRERMDRQELQSPDRVWDAIRSEASRILGDDLGGVSLHRDLTVILVVGVNGVGKTTTIGKMASRFQAEGHKVMLAAGDTFRAAAVLQLEVWGRRVGCPVVKGKDSADPGAVIFDAIQRAQAEGANVVIADTAGRLHTKAPLMEELKKVGRTVEKALGRPADQVLLVLDSTNGQNAIQQAQMFSEALPVNGIALTKLDGTAKGGVVLGIVDQHHLPVHYIGIGERVEDLREFEPRAFVRALFEKPPEDTAAA